MTSLLDYFPLAYVINLPERTDRLKEVRASLESAGLPLRPGRVEVFPGVKPDGPGGFPSLGVRGCFLSHLGILRAALAKGAPRVLVFEDDVDFSPRLESETPRLIQSLSSRDWGIFFLGHLVEGTPSDAALMAHTGPLTQAHAYAVNGPVLPRLVRYLEAVLERPAGHPDGGPMHLDGAYNMFRERNADVQTLLACPSLAHQRSSRSDITPGALDRIPGLQFVMGVARKVKRALTGRSSR